MYNRRSPHPLPSVRRQHRRGDRLWGCARVPSINHCPHSLVAVVYIPSRTCYLFPIFIPFVRCCAVMPGPRHPLTCTASPPSTASWTVNPSSPRSFSSSSPVDSSVSDRLLIKSGGNCCCRAVNQGVEEMIKYLANEPSLGLFFVQQHAQNAMPNALNLKVIGGTRGRPPFRSRSHLLFVLFFFLASSTTVLLVLSLLLYHSMEVGLMGIWKLTVCSIGRMMEDGLLVILLLLSVERDTIIGRKDWRAWVQTDAGIAPSVI